MGIRPGLDSIRAVDELLGRPCEGLPITHIVGTNGKGSTAAMIEHGLRAAGVTTGLFTSPHLHRIGERVRIEGAAVSDDEVGAAHDRVLAAERAAAERLSFFEVITLAALVIFAGRGVGEVVLEAGLGGRLDSTRLRRSRMVVLTRVGLDHQAFLGPDLASIAFEKLAVVEPHHTLVHGPQAPEVEGCVVARIAQTGCRSVRAVPTQRPPKGLPGRHQAENAGLALAALAAAGYGASIDVLDAVSWPGRLEFVARGRGGGVWFDVAHNPQGIAALVDSVARIDAVVFGVMPDKDVGAMLDVLEGLGAELWWVAAQAPPGHAAVDVLAGLDDEALWRRIETVTAAGGRVLVCGSHQVVGPVRGRLLGEAGDALALHDPRSIGPAS